MSFASGFGGRPGTERGNKLQIPCAYVTDAYDSGTIIITSLLFAAFRKNDTVLISTELEVNN